jgi:hypothetical protein
MEEIMRTTIYVTNLLIRLTGAIQIVLGLLIWVGLADTLITVHILSGVLLVVSLWVLAFACLQIGMDGPFAGVAIVWGLIILVLGLTQNQILPGSSHWVIQVLHLLVGLGAIGLGEGLAARASRIPGQAI